MFIEYSARKWMVDGVEATGVQVDIQVKPGDDLPGLMDIVKEGRIRSSSCTGSPCLRVRANLLPAALDRLLKAFPGADLKDHQDTPEDHRMSAIFSMHGEQFRYLQDTLNFASGPAESKKDGHLLDLICLSYMSNEALKENVDDVGLKRILMELDRIYGLAILAGNDEKVVFASRKMLKVLGLEQSGPSNT